MNKLCTRQRESRRQTDVITVLQIKKADTRLLVKLKLPGWHQVGSIEEWVKSQICLQIRCRFQVVLKCYGSRLPSISRVSKFCLKSLLVPTYLPIDLADMIQSVPTWGPTMLWRKAQKWCLAWNAAKSENSKIQMLDGCPAHAEM